MDFFEIMLQQKMAGGGGSGGVSVDELSVTENGTYTAEEGHAYSPVTVSVPNSYSASDEGKVVSNGALVGQTSATKTANGTYDTTLNNEIVVNVPGIVPSGTKSITENGTYDVTDFASANVNVSGSGGGSAPRKAVNFYDYDGTIVDSYTASEFTNLSAMPANPSHTGLTAQGWNWSLADAKTYVAKYGALNIGQMYITTSGDTEIDIELHDRLEPVLGIAPNGTVEIDWGDGSAKDTITGTSLTTNMDTQHIYASEGSYTIKLHVVSGSFAIYGDSSKGSQLLHKTGTTSSEWRVYQNAIQAVRIGDNTSIGNNAFYKCYSLTSITIPNGVTNIGSSAFNNCSSLASATIPDGVTSIENNAFNECCSLASVMIPNDATNIGAFQNCYSLTSITIPNGVTNIGSSAFIFCASLTLVTIPDSVTSIGNNAFQDCRSLTSVTIPNDVISIEDSTFKNCYSLASVTILNGVTNIGNSAFVSCYSLVSVTIPDGVTNIGNFAFQGCASLTLVTIPDSVTSIGNSVFSYCYSLVSVTIPNNVTSIGNSAFGSCQGVKRIDFLPTIPPTVANANAFSNLASDLVVYVPNGTLATYQAVTNYKNIASRMVERAA